MDGLLLHTCCGPCGTAALPAWRARGVEPVLYFANPNIQPDAELARRTTAVQQFAAASEVALIVAAQPDAEAWRSELGAALQGSADERCRLCLRVRLSAAADAAGACGVPRFSTTLSVSPYQRHDLIDYEGRAAAERAGVEFIYLDLRDQYRSSIAESRRLGLYRQPYCGCVPSKWEAWQQRRARKRRSA